MKQYTNCTDAIQIKSSIIFRRAVNGLIPVPCLYGIRQTARLSLCQRQSSPAG
jgi:hypothetical protein